MKPIKGARITNSADANDFMGNYYSVKVCADERLPDWRFTFADQVMVTFYYSDDTVVHKCPVSVNFQRSKDQHVSAQNADNHVVRVGFVPADMVSVMVDTVELRIPISRIEAKWASIKVHLQALSCPHPYHTHTVLPSPRGTIIASPLAQAWPACSPLPQLSPLSSPLLGKAHTLIIFVPKLQLPLCQQRADSDANTVF